MALYTRESRDRVRDAVDFVELVSARTELRRAGPSRYEGLCPFHDERTPSFGIDPAQKVYHCFGCQASGDLFTFVQETENVDFKGALELLAQRAGIELELEQEDPADAQRRKSRERLLELLSRTASFYERMLWDSEEADPAREYLAGRGLGEEALRSFRVGYAPSAWDRVLVASLKSGYSERELLAVGLAQRSREGGGRPYDRFRRRIMFPLCDMRGRVLGFGARELAAERGDRRGPKYINTAETEVFQKGHHLYGAHLARAAAAKAGSVVLCEGYTDVIALHQAGMENVVGSMGTALTERQLGELSRLSPVVELALDADAAGQEAMMKVARLAAGRRLELRAVELPGGLDPADLVQQRGAEAMRAAAKGSVPFVRFQVEQALRRGDESTPEGQDKILDELRPIFATLAPSALRFDIERMLASRLGMNESQMQALLGGPNAQRSSRSAGSWEAGRPRRSQAREGGPSSDESRRPPDGRPPGASGRPAAGGALERRMDGRAVGARRRQVELAFLSLCVSAPEIGAAALTAIEPEEHFSDRLLRELAVRLRVGDLRQPMAIAGEDEEELRRALAEIVVEAGRGRASEATLRVSALQLELGHLDRLIQAARAGGSIERDGQAAVFELAQRRAEVKRDIDAAQELALQDGP